MNYTLDEVKMFVKDSFESLMERETFSVSHSFSFTISPYRSFKIYIYMNVLYTFTWLFHSFRTENPMVECRSMDMNRTVPYRTVFLWYVDVGAVKTTRIAIKLPVNCCNMPFIIWNLFARTHKHIYGVEFCMHCALGWISVSSLFSFTSPHSISFFHFRPFIFHIKNAKFQP